MWATTAILIKIKATKSSTCSFNREYASVSPLFNDDPHKYLLLSDLQITVVSHKMPLFGLQIRSTPRLAYRHVCLLNRPRRGVLPAFCHRYLSSLHAIRTSCTFFVTHKFTANSTDSTLYTTNSRAFLNVYASSAHMPSQVQNACHCSSICPASLPTSSSSAGILLTKWYSSKTALYC